MSELESVLRTSTDPLIVHELSGCDSFVRIYLEYLADYILAFVANNGLMISLSVNLVVVIGVREYEFACLNLSIKILLKFSKEG